MSISNKAKGMTICRILLYALNRGFVFIFYHGTLLHWSWQNVNVDVKMGSLLEPKEKHATFCAGIFLIKKKGK